LKILVADNAVLVRSLTVIANSDEHHGKTMVCDFDSLISVATAGLKEHEQLLKGNTSPIANNKKQTSLCSTWMERRQYVFSRGILVMQP
jgi:hypothetical protein